MTNAGTTRTIDSDVLVIGGGIAGITVALEAAEAGCRVVLAERAPFLGGRVVRSHLYFPKLCPPGCGLEINFKRLKSNPRVTVVTMAEFEHLAGSAGEYVASLRLDPRYVTDACTCCGDCATVCPATRADEFNFGLSRTSAAYLPHSTAFPATFVIDRAACQAGCTACAEACKYGAVVLDQAPAHLTVRAAAVVAATGWAPYDATRLDTLGFGTCRNVITNVIMERLAAPNGPTGGRIVRPSDGELPASVAFAQCAGSRDENHLPYCSAVCCAASLKQATYVRTLNADAKVTIYYIDIRTPGRLEDFYTKVAADAGVRFVKGKVAAVSEDPATGDVLVTAEDTSTGTRSVDRVALLVLATGIVPQTAGLPGGYTLDPYGFITTSPEKAGLYAAGCARRPEEVSASLRDATGAALKALQSVVRSARHA